MVAPSGRTVGAHQEVMKGAGPAAPAGTAAGVGWAAGAAVKIARSLWGVVRGGVCKVGRGGGRGARGWEGSGKTHSRPSTSSRGPSVGAAGAASVAVGIEGAAVTGAIEPSEEEAGDGGTAMLATREERSSGVRCVRRIVTSSGEMDRILRN